MSKGPFKSPTDMSNGSNRYNFIKKLSSEQLEALRFYKNGNYVKNQPLLDLNHDQIRNILKNTSTTVYKELNNTELGILKEMGYEEFDDYIEQAKKNKRNN